MREVRSQWSISNPKVKLMIHVTMYIYMYMQILYTYLPPLFTCGFKPGAG